MAGNTPAEGEVHTLTQGVSPGEVKELHEITEAGCGEAEERGARWGWRGRGSPTTWASWATRQCDFYSSVQREWRGRSCYISLVQRKIMAEDGFVKEHVVSFSHSDDPMF